MVDQRFGFEKYDYPVLTPEEDAAQRGSDPPSVRTDPPKPTGPKADDAATKDRQEQVRKWLDGQRDRKGGGRKDQLWPYLLVRAMAGDSGGRPLPAGQPFWESPDVLVVPGTPATYDGVSATLNPTPGQPHTVFVRVWNLGHLGAVGVKVRVWWANPSFSFDDPNHPPTFIGAQYVDLPDRRNPQCVQLVRIPASWVPVVENGGHECLLAKVECFADGSAPGYGAAMNRHVGQRNLMLATGGATIEPVLVRLGATLAAGTHVEVRHSVADLQTMILVQQPTLLGKITTPAIVRDTLLAPVTAPPVAMPVDAWSVDMPVGAPQFPMPFTPPPAAGPAVTPPRTAAPPVAVPSARPVFERRLGAAAAINTPYARIVPGETLADAARGRGGKVDPGDFHIGRPGVVPIAEHAAPLVGMLGLLGFRDLAGRAIAQRLGGSADAGHMLRFEATRDGRVVGGYTIIVADTAG